MDTAVAQNKGNRFSGVVLELKTLSDAPHWMMDLVMHFDLERTGQLQVLYRGLAGVAFRADGPSAPCTRRRCSHW